jgi:hypothetical protein
MTVFLSVRKATDIKKPLKNRGLSIVFGGGGGIRTHVRFNPKHTFQACALSHSATSPKLLQSLPVYLSWVDSTWRLACALIITVL